MKTKKLLCVLLIVALVLSCIPLATILAQPSAPSIWGDARWIWSSASTDRGSATKYLLNNGFQYFTFDNFVSAPSGSTKVANYDDLAAKENVWMNFRRDFTLDSVPAVAKINIAVDSKYWMWINGVPVVWEGQVKRGVNPEDTYYDTLDIAPHLKSGKNVIAIGVWFWGGSRSFSYNSSGSGGLLFYSDLTDSATGGKVVSGDGQWKALKDPSKLPDSLNITSRLCEQNYIYDSRLAIDWINPAYNAFAADNWNTASIIGAEDGARKGMPGSAPWNQLYERPIPQWRDYGRSIAQAQAVRGYPVDTFSMKTLAQMGVTTAPYSISADMVMNFGTLAGYYNRNNGGLIFGASSESDYYMAQIDGLEGFTVSGNGNPVFRLRKSGSTANLLGPISLSHLINIDNYDEPHNITVKVNGPMSTKFYVDDTLVGEITTIDFTDLNKGFGVWCDRRVMTYILGDTTFSSIKVSDNAGFTYVNKFDSDAEQEDFPRGAFKNSALSLIDPVFYGRATYAGQRYQIRMPYNAQIVPYLKLGAGTPAGKSIIMTTETFNQSNQRISYVTKAGEQEYEAQPWINGDYLYFDVPSGVTVVDFGYRETGYDIASGQNTDFEGYFNSVINAEDAALTSFTGGHTWKDSQTDADNNFYDEMWKKAARTVYVTIRDNFMDCPDRERAQYIGDAVNEAEQAYYSQGAGLDDLTAKAIRDICNWQYKFERNGRTYYAMSNVRPGGNAQEISIQTLGTAHMALNHYLFAGDKKLIMDTYQPLYNYLTNYDLAASGQYQGLIDIRSVHGFSGMNTWSDWGNNLDFHISTNVWWYISAKSVRQMAEVPGVASTQAQKDWLDAYISSVEQNFEKFWNNNLKAYATNWATGQWQSKAARIDGTHLVDDRVNALAVTAGLVPKEKYGAMRDVFMGTDTTLAYENASIYMEKYVLEALYMMGYPKDAMYRMQKRYMNCVNEQSSSTLPEHFAFSADGTKNHGWSGGGQLALSRYAAGIEPTAPGYSKWHVVPQLGNFEKINTRVPSEIGNIDVNLVKSASSLTMDVVSPGNDAEIWVPLGAGQGAVQVSGAQAEYQGIKKAYNASYAVFAITGAGAYSFKTASSASIAGSSMSYIGKNDIKPYIAVGDIENAYVFTIDLKFDKNILSFDSINFAEDFSGYTLTMIENKATTGGCTLTVGSKQPINIAETTRLFDLSFTKVLDQSATTTITAAVSAGTTDAQDISADVIFAMDPESLTIRILSIADACDINKDGKVSVSDLSVAMKYYGAKQGDSIWAKAEKCDVNGDGSVDMADLIMILANYTN